MAPSVLVTGGPTRAYLDEVRYLSNYSTGQLAYWICKRLSEAGSEVHAVIGPCSPDFESLNLASLKRVETVHQMWEACRQRGDSQWGVFAAAVLDFEPTQRASGKVSSQGSWTLELRPTPKIIDAMHREFPAMKRVGFKLEWDLPEGTEQRNAFAQARIRQQSLEGLVLNSLSSLSPDRHPAHLYRKSGGCRDARDKREIAEWIAALILEG